MGDHCRLTLMDDFFLGEEMIRLEWPAWPPDMNPIKYVLDILGRRDANHLPVPQTTRNVKRTLLKAWIEYPSSSLLVSLTPCLKSVQCCWPPGVTIPPCRNYFLKRKHLFYPFFSHTQIVFIFFHFCPNSQYNAFFLSNICNIFFI